MAMNGAASPFHSPYLGAPSPWSQIVAAAAPSMAIAGESTAVNSAPVEESDNSFRHNVSGNKRPVWNKPSNGASSSVMDADSWPALSESARAPGKSPPESAKGSVDASQLQQLQGTGGTLPSPKRQVRDNASMNNMAPTHQKPFRRSNSNLSSNGGHPPQSSAPQGSVAATGAPNHNSLQKDHQQRTGVVSNDHPQQHHQRNLFRNRNGGPHQRGDGGHYHNYGNRRDQDRGNQDSNNTHRNFNGRDNYMSPRFVPRFRPSPPPNHAQIYAPPPPPPMQAYGGSIGFPELPPPFVYVSPPPLDPLRGVPIVPPMPPNATFYPPSDPQLHTKIVNQIDYYFSDENLIKDVYLRRKMDDQGWVSINLISSFKRVKHLTDNIQLVIDAIQTSSVVEVEGDKIRRRNDWTRWIVHPPVRSSSIRSSKTMGQLAEQVQNITLETIKNDVEGLDVSQNRSYDYSNNQHPFHC